MGLSVKPNVLSVCTQIIFINGYSSFTFYNKFYQNGRISEYLGIRSHPYRTLAVAVAQNIELLTHALSGIRHTIIFIPDKKAKIPDSPVI